MAKEPEFEEDILLDANAFASVFADGLEDICTVVSVLLAEYADDIEQYEVEEDYEDDYEMIPRATVTFLSNVQPKWNSTFFERPTKAMQSHLKPLFIRVEVNGRIPVQKTLIDGGAAVNLVPKSMLKKFNKTEEDLIPHNMVVTNFSGKTSDLMA